MQFDQLTTATHIGILGGAFDPIHFGHLAIAEEARVRLGLDVILFIPAGRPPHKPTGQADAEQRFLMATLATADHPRFFVSRLEVDRDGPSYTVDTLRALRETYPQAVLHLLVGADMALDFPSWREPRTILSLARLVAVTRPGYPIERLQQLRETPGMESAEILTAPGLDISSTDIRARLRDGMSVRYLTPDAVAAYIAKTGLYRSAGRNVTL